MASFTAHCSYFLLLKPSILTICVAWEGKTQSPTPIHPPSAPPPAGRPGVLPLGGQQAPLLHRVAAGARAEGGHPVGDGPGLRRAAAAAGAGHPRRPRAVGPAGPPVGGRLAAEFCGHF